MECSVRFAESSQLVTLNTTDASQTVQETLVQAFIKIGLKQESISGLDYVTILPYGQFPMFVSSHRFSDKLNQFFASNNAPKSVTLFVPALKRGDTSTSKPIVVTSYADKVQAVTKLANNQSLVALKSGIPSSPEGAAIRNSCPLGYDAWPATSKFGVGPSNRIGSDIRPRAQIWDDLRMRLVDLKKAQSAGAADAIQRAEANLRQVQNALEIYASVVIRRVEWLSRIPSDVVAFTALDRLNVDETMLLKALINWAQMYATNALDSLPQENNTPITLLNGYAVAKATSGALWQPELLGAIEKYIRWTEITNPELLEAVLPLLPVLGGKNEVCVTLRAALVTFARLRHALGNLTAASGLVPKGTTTSSPADFSRATEIEATLDEKSHDPDATTNAKTRGDDAKRGAAGNYLELKGNNPHKRPTARQRRQLKINLEVHQEAVRRRLAHMVNSENEVSESQAEESTESVEIIPKSYGELREYLLSKQRPNTQQVSQTIKRFAQNRSTPNLVEAKTFEDYEADGVPISPVTVFERLLQLAESPVGQILLGRNPQVNLEILKNAKEALASLKSAIKAAGDDLYLNATLPFPLLSPRRGRFVDEMFGDTCYRSYFESSRFSDAERSAPYLSDEAEAQLTLDYPIGPCLSTWGFEVLAAASDSQLNVGVTWTRKFRRTNDSMLPIKPIESKSDSGDPSMFEIALDTGVTIPVRSTVWFRCDPLDNSYQVSSDVFPYWIDALSGLKRLSDASKDPSSRFITTGHGILTRDFPDYSVMISRVVCAGSLVNLDDTEVFASDVLTRPMCVGSSTLPRDIMPTIIFEKALVRGVRPMNFE